MLTAAYRKARNLALDPVLRRWTVEAVCRRATPIPTLRRSFPPYLARDPALGSAVRGSNAPFQSLAAKEPQSPITLSLPGDEARLAPGDADSLFSRSYADLETLLAVHRFAWLPVSWDSADSGWVEALWTAWLRRHRDPDDTWAWHPYTVAERAINLLDYAQRRGLPGPREATLDCLTAHGGAIASRLEYFGEENTSNHLSNNGRGLFLLGLALGIPEYADLGGQILLAEARRIFCASGILREGSSHYHLLLTRNYASAWLAALAHRRREAAELGNVTKRALAVLPYLQLPGRFPLVGDISPDCPPHFLFGLLPGMDLSMGWCGSLSERDRLALQRLKDETPRAATPLLGADGWVRFDAPPWSGLWHAAPAGWSAMPGHAHQDLGGFEVHFRESPLLIDLGRGAYGERGSHYASALAHNGVVVDGHDPYPPNRPYYDDRFRRSVVGTLPRLVRHGDGLELSHDGYRRLGGVGTLTRRWMFAPDEMVIEDALAGRGHHQITRLLHTPLDVEPTHGGFLVGGRFKISTVGETKIKKTVAWSAYGVGAPATTIEITEGANLPWAGSVVVEVI